MAHGVVLRAVQPGDLPLFFAHQLDPVSHRMAAFAPRDRAAFDAHWSRILVDPAVTVRAIVCDGVLVGNVGSFVEGGKLQVGYWLGQEHWGRGIATRALSLFLDQMQQRPLYAHVARHNIGSARVLQKCGFEMCGVQAGVPDGMGGVVEDMIFKLRAAADTDEAEPERDR